MPTVSITQEEWDAMSAFQQETFDKCESANDEYVEWFNQQNEHFLTLQKKFRKAKIKQETKALIKKALK
ncbi:hypothetical protein [Acinetobacter modestus]|uniref:hypothetical protein n=1 Tax=Acinetobacter modestus TaxID=1776740 RepID=UPI0030179765